ncbi:MAG: nucleotide exchange factor GrpE [Thermoanaerobaculia bacterium]|nr:nucleotide exchange factor GrpE [Thermoanaerobaculia bacterium]
MEEKTNGPDESAKEAEQEEEVYVLDDDDDSTYESLLEEVEASKQGETEVTGLEPADPSDAEAKVLAENQELKDRYMRILADHENFKRRTEKERIETWGLAVSEVIRELLPVLDNFERAIQSGRVHDPDSEMLSGIEMIYEQLVDVIRKQGVSVIEETDTPFDPQIHEGVHREERPDVPAHTVIEVLQKGYALKGRLIRPAMVNVAVGGPEPEGPGTQDSEESEEG